MGDYKPRFVVLEEDDIPGPVRFVVYVEELTHNVILDFGKNGRVAITKTDALGFARSILKAFEEDNDGYDTDQCL